MEEHKAWFLEYCNKEAMQQYYNNAIKHENI